MDDSSFPPCSLNSEVSAVSIDTVSEDFFDVSEYSPARESNPCSNVIVSSDDAVGAVDQIGCDYRSGIFGDVERDAPHAMMNNVTVLSCESSAEGGVCEVCLVGTAHVSQESCREVQSLIRSLKPEVVFLELCCNRVAVLSSRNLEIPTVREMVDMWKKNQNLFGILYSWFLAKVADKLEVFPGSEFRVAYEEAMKYGGKVILGDRPVHITLRRTWGSMPLWHKTKLIFSLFFQAVFLPNSEELNNMLKEMDDVDALTLLIKEMSKQFPTLMETLVHERDKYMSSTLLSAASTHNSVVAVVGKGHLQGITKHWRQPIKLEDLMESPKQKPIISTRSICISIGVTVLGAAIISGYVFAIKKK